MAQLMVLREFRDVTTGEIRKKGDIFEADSERAEHLVKRKFCTKVKAPEKVKKVKIDK